MKSQECNNKQAVLTNLKKIRRPFLFDHSRDCLSSMCELKCTSICDDVVP